MVVLVVRQHKGFGSSSTVIGKPQMASIRHSFDAPDAKCTDRSVELPQTPELLKTLLVINIEVRLSNAPQELTRRPSPHGSMPRDFVADFPCAATVYILQHAFRDRNILTW